ncbi:hypothetical protein DSL72_000481 [Monilinia vaccinii-corymbosi]|uniref:Uncharacterized protein n=1 Tax=Monilinia vaccinii-corymbosi TaxID=61207 RepID=A0A8A3NZF7_9HELO|nr:hypothetical protein DSL72_000481 [Monilinia vaccinii-corymbosi]
MSVPCNRPVHYQGHYQSMVLNFCVLYPYFEADTFDRAYILEIASVLSQYPATGLDFCYYWTERVLWDRFGFSGAYGEFPGRYGGPGSVVQQQTGANSMPPTLQSAQPAPTMTPDFSAETLLGTQLAQQTLGQAPEASQTQGVPASQFGQERIDLITMPSTPLPSESSQRLARNLFEGFRNPINSFKH